MFLRRPPSNQGQLRYCCIAVIGWIMSCTCLIFCTVLSAVNNFKKINTKIDNIIAHVPNSAGTLGWWACLQQGFGLENRIVFIQYTSDGIFSSDQMFLYTLLFESLESPIYLDRVQSHHYSICNLIFFLLLCCTDSSLKRTITLYQGFAKKGHL